MLSGDNKDDHLYDGVSKQKIEKVIKQFPIVDDQGKQFSLFDNVEKFKKFSPGIYLLFRLLKHIIIMFCVIGIISLIQLIFLLISPYYQGFENVVRVNLLRITIASLQSQHYNIYIGLDFAIVLIVSGFLIWWSQKLRDFAKKCNQTNKLPSYLTVQLQYIPQNFSQIGLLKQLQNVYGVYPYEIYVGKDYGKFLKHYSKLTSIALNFRVHYQLFLHQQTEEGKRIQAYYLIKQFLKVKQKYFKIKSEQFNQRQYITKQVFIVLQNYHDRQKLLKSQQNYARYLFSRFIKKQQFFEFKPCQIQPDAIVWQNIGISTLNYYFRFFTVFLLLCACSCFGVIIIFMLEVLETASIGDAYYFHEQFMGTDKRSTNEQNYQCQQLGSCGTIAVTSDNAKLTLLIILTPIIIFIFKKLMMAILSHTVYFRKYPNEVSKLKSQTLTLTFFYFTVVAALHLVLYLKSSNSNSQLSMYQILYPITVKLFDIAHYSPSSIHMYTDFSLDWYKQATFFIVIISSTSFNVANAFKFTVGLVSFYFQKIAALKQKTMYGVLKKFHGVNLHVENAYASMHTIVLFALLYGCPIPITILFSLLNLLFLFYTLKWTFIKYGAKPLRMGHSLSRVSINILLIGVIIHCIMAPIFLGATGIGSQDSHYFWTINHPNIHIAEISLTIGERFKKFGPFYFTVAILIFLYISCRKLFRLHLLKKIKKLLNKVTDEDPQTAQLSTIGKQQQYFGLYPSYSMHFNKKYSQILKNVEILNKIEAKRSKKIITQISDDDQRTCSTRKSQIFQEIVKANRKYIDLEKNRKMFEEVQQIAKILGYSNDGNKEYLNAEYNQPSAQRTININTELGVDTANIDQILETQN